MLGAFGVILILNRFAWFTQELAAFLDSIGLGRLQTLGWHVPDWGSRREGGILSTRRGVEQSGSSSGS